MSALQSAQNSFAPWDAAGDAPPVTGSTQNQRVGKCDLGEYELLEPLCNVRNGRIFKARDRAGRIVAIKTLGAAQSRDQRQLIRFYQEAKFAMSLDHPNLIQIHEVGEDGGVHFIVMEYVPGETLAACLDRNGKFSEEYAVRIITAVADALAAIHDCGLVHRNVHPGNVLLTRDGDVKLLDFGLAKSLGDGLQLTTSGEGLGCPCFVAPEQFRDAKNCDVAADIYGLGATLYAMVTGALPFGGGSLVEKLKKKVHGQYVPPETYHPGLNPVIVHVIRWAMAGDASARPKNVRTFIDSVNTQHRTIGNLELLGQISHGLTGPVFRARSADGETVAVKALCADAAANQATLARFYQEAKLALQIDHPNVVRTLEVGESDGQHYIVMEYVDGDNLAWHVKKRGCLPEAEALQLIIDVARALEAVHNQGHIHRNVNPCNILVDCRGSAKLSDLGFAKSFERDYGLTCPGKGLGTPQYMAPEQFRDARTIDARADVYALGATLYATVTGRLPFHRESLVEQFKAKNNNDFVPPERHNPAISLQTASLIKRALDASPSNRPQTAAAFRSLAETALDRLRMESSSEVRPQTQPQEPRWEVIYFSQEGQLTGRRGTSAEIGRKIRRGRIGLDARVRRDGDEKYRPVAAVAEFRPYLADRQEFPVGKLTYVCRNHSRARAGLATAVAVLACLRSFFS
jgi:serine/threonine protein kinase